MDGKKWHPVFLAGLLLLFLSGPRPRPLAAPQLFGKITEPQEVQVGREAAAQVEREYPMLRDRSAQRYLQSLGERLARNSDRTSISYQFRIIDKPEVNAFALPGGYIYVFRGILQLARNESELAGVLAHEIAHVSERHHVDQMEKAQYLGLGLGLLDILLGERRNTAENLGALGANLFAQGVFFKFSRDAEREADQEGVKILRRSGIDPWGMVTLFQRMESLRDRQPGLVDQFFASHPRLSERQANVSALLQSSDSSLTQDSREFQRVKRSLGGNLKVGR